MTTAADSPLTDAALAPVVSYVHDLLRLYEAAAQEDLGECERLIDITQPIKRIGPPSAAMTRLDAIGFAIACVGEVLVRRDGPAVATRVLSVIETHYGWTSSSLLKQLWGTIVP